MNIHRTVEDMAKQFKGLIEFPEEARARALPEFDEDWSEDGAQELLNLVRHYGFHMLKQATALAIALEIEDGDLGYT